MTTHHISNGARPAGPESLPERTGVRVLDEAIREPVEPATLARLLDDLAERADHNGSLDVGYDVVDTPIGGLLLAATPRGLVRVAFESEGYEAVLADLAERLSPRILRAPGRLAPVRAQVGEYFEGRRRQFSVEVDLSLTSGFRREVLDVLRAVEFGDDGGGTGLAGRAPDVVDRLAASDRDQPRLDVGPLVQVGVGTQRGQERLGPGVLGVVGAEQRGAHAQHGGPVASHHLLERNSRHTR